MEPQNIIDFDNHRDEIDEDLEMVEFMCSDFFYSDHSDELDNIDIYNLSND